MNLRRQRAESLQSKTHEDRIVRWPITIWLANLFKHKGRAVLRGDSVKDSGAYAFFFWTGLSSASQMTAAKVMDVIAICLDCDGQAADAISAYTQVKMEDARQIAQKF